MWKELKFFVLLALIVLAATAPIKDDDSSESNEDESNKDTEEIGKDNEDSNGEEDEEEGDENAEERSSVGKKCNGYVTYRN